MNWLLTALHPSPAACRTSFRSTTDVHHGLTDLNMLTNQVMSLRCVLLKRGKRRLRLDLARQTKPLAAHCANTPVNDTVGTLLLDLRVNFSPSNGRTHPPSCAYW